MPSKSALSWPLAYLHASQLEPILSPWYVAETQDGLAEDTIATVCMLLQTEHSPEPAHTIKHPFGWKEISGAPPSSSLPSSPHLFSARETSSSRDMAHELPLKQQNSKGRSSLLVSRLKHMLKACIATLWDTMDGLPVCYGFYLAGEKAPVLITAQALRRKVVLVVYPKKIIAQK